MSNSDFYARQAGYLIAVARGQVPGAYPISGFGKYVATGAISNQIIWPDGAFNIPPAGGVQISLVSNSPNDTAAGTGARQVEVHYLDGTLVEKVEIVTLNGLTPVAMVETKVSFIQCLHVHAAGSLLSAAGTIIAYNGATTYSILGPGTVRCASSARMVPKGKRLFVSDISAGASSGTAAANVQIELVATQLDNRVYTYAAPGLWIPHGINSLQDDTAVLSISCPGPFSESAIVALRGTTDKAATLAGTWFGWLENAA